MKTVKSSRNCECSLLPNSDSLTAVKQKCLEHCNFCCCDVLVQPRFVDQYALRLLSSMAGEKNTSKGLNNDEVLLVLDDNV